MHNRRSVILGAAAFAASFGSRALAQSYPSRPITIVVPYAAGGATDVIARVIGQNLQQRLGMAVVVENKPGATTAVGTHYVARSAPDGHTLLLTAPPFVIGRYASPKPSYDSTKDFAPIVLATSSPLIVAIGSKLPVNTMREFLAYARANRGKLNYGSTGTMGLPHLAAELLCRRADLTMTHVPYRGGGQVVTDLISGQVDLYFGNPVEIAPQLSQGIKALAVTSAERFSLMPDLPTVQDSGVADYDLQTWTGLLAPAGTSPAIVEKLNATVDAILREGAVAQNLKDQFGVPEGGSLNKFNSFLALQHRTFAPLVAQMEQSQQ